VDHETSLRARSMSVGQSTEGKKSPLTEGPESEIKKKSRHRKQSHIIKKYKEEITLELIQNTEKPEIYPNDSQQIIILDTNVEKPLELIKEPDSVKEEEQPKIEMNIKEDLVEHEEESISEEYMDITKLQVTYDSGDDKSEEDKDSEKKRKQL